jgi:aminoglycoside 6'-N-acetyltransferase I
MPRRKRAPARAPAVPRVRPATARDLDAIAALAHALWPEGTAAEHRQHARRVLAGKASTMPMALFVAEQDERVIGFVEVGLRSHADGCDERRPVGFLEGWMVEAAQRRRGVGRALVQAAEAWAAAQGCREMASDTWADHRSSERAHLALGYQVTDRCVNFRKALPRLTRRRTTG